MTAERRQGYRADDRTTYPYSYDGNAVRQPQWEDTPTRGTRPTRKRRTRRKLDLQVREPGRIAPFAVVGLFMVCGLLALVLSQNATLVAVNDEAVQLRTDLANLEQEEAKLVAQHEMAYDLQAIEQEMLGSGEMVKAQSSQVYTIDLTRPDSVEYYKNSIFGGDFLSSLRGIFSRIGTYF